MIDRLKRLHTPSMPLVWTVPTTHCSSEWLTVSWPGVGVGDTEVGLQFVGVDRFGFVFDRTPYKGMQRMLTDVRDAFEPNVPATLNRASDPCLPRFGCPCRRLACDLRRAFRPLQRFPNSRGTGEGNRFPSPRGCDGTGASPFDTTRCRASASVGWPTCPFGIRTSGRSRQTTSKRKVRIMHNRAGRDAEVVAAAETVPLAAALDFGHVHIPAMGAGNPFGQRSVSRYLRHLWLQSNRSNKASKSMDHHPKKKATLPKDIETDRMLKWRS